MVIYEGIFNGKLIKEDDCRGESVIVRVKVVEIIMKLLYFFCMLIKIYISWREIIFEWE